MAFVEVANLLNIGFNVLQELVFSDGVTWLARIPLPNNCFQPDEMYSILCCHS